MDKLQELLPGIEEFLTETLGHEKLSLAAEERRQFFLERLDIIKLPPSLPPREGRKLSPELLKETEQTSGVPSLLSSPGVAAVVCPDFAAAQRLIARSQAGHDGTVSGTARPEGDEQLLLPKDMKVYDDIDLPESPEQNSRLLSESSLVRSGSKSDNVNKTSNDHDERIDTITGGSETVENNPHHYESGRDDDEENDHYEIPVARQQLPSTDEAGGVELGSPAKTLEGSASINSVPGSVEELTEGGSADGVFESPPPVPPPLPPRRDVNVRWSDSELRSPLSGSGSFEGGKSSGSGDVPPELPFRPPQLPRRGELVMNSGTLRSEKSEQSEKSDDRSDGEISDGGSTSYESFDEDHDQHGPQLHSKLHIKLPAKPAKKYTLGSKKSAGSGGNKKSQLPLSKSRLSSQWEISVPFKQLDNIDISGELYHRGKLSWNRRVVAITAGCLAMYKPDKDGSRPSLVLQLMGYSAAVSDREGRRGYEIRITHPSDDTHTFAVDFRDWANLWAEHINGTGKGQPPPKYHTHLARTFSGGEVSTPPPTGSKSDLTASNSNLSTGSEGTGDEASKPKLRGNKVIRMGSFAYRATQFFETIGKKTTLKRKSSHPGSHVSDGSTSSKTDTRRQHQLLSKTSSSSFGDLRNGIVEETSQVSPSGSIGLGMSAISPSSDSGLPPLFSGCSDACSLGDCSASLSGSGTPSQDSPLALYAPACRQRSKSGGSMAGDSFDLEGEDTGDPDPFLGVSHKGYLYVFSSFNKRRWGRRWCVIRTNLFECYHHRRSKSAGQGRLRQGEECWETCELSFTLKPCVLRRAVKETGSELGLMLVEDGKEKITVEALSVDEMGAWVRALLSETSTVDVPDGLEDFLKEFEYAEADNGTVLQQWGLDNFVSGSSHEYEDPQATADFKTHSKSGFKNTESIHMSKDCSGESLVDESTSGDSTLVLNSCFPTDDSETADTTLVAGPQEVHKKKDCESQEFSVNAQQTAMIGAILPNVCRTSPGSKNTDSGCYSGQGANSDSDSGCENSSSARDMLDTDGGYATLDSSFSISRQAGLYSEETSEASKKISSKVESYALLSNEKISATLCDSTSESFSAESSSDCTSAGISAVSSLTEMQENSIGGGTLIPSHSYSSNLSSSCPLSSSSSNQPSIIPPSVPCAYSNDFEAAFNTKTLDKVSVNVSSSLEHCNTSTSPEMSNFYVPGGEEYSLVVKRSDKPSLESSQISCGNGGESGAATLTSTNSSVSPCRSLSSTIEAKPIDQNSQHVCLSKGKTSEDSTNAGEEEEDSVFQSIMVDGSDSTNIKIFSEEGNCAEIRAEIEHALSLSCNNNNESFYEPVGQALCVANLTIDTQTKDSFSSSQVPPPYICGLQTSSIKDKTSQSSSTSLCTSSEPSDCPSEVEDGLCAKSYMIDSELAPLEITPSKSSQQLESSGDSSHHDDLSMVCEVVTDNDKNNIMTYSDTGHGSENTKEVELRVIIPACPSADDLRPDYNLASISPSADLVTSLLENPAATAQDLQQAMDRLKDKQGQIRRKRMAVHDKRQRVSNDGERLACEKEMAALEKFGEDTDSDLRAVKNKLAVLQGESLDVLCGATNQPQTYGQGQNRRSKSGSRKKKQKRKS